MEKIINEKITAIHCGQMVISDNYYKNIETGEIYFICPICLRKIVIKK